MAGNDREESQCPLKVIAERIRVMNMEKYEWTEEDKAYFDKMIRRAKEEELRNLTETWAGEEPGV